MVHTGGSVQEETRRKSHGGMNDRLKKNDDYGVDYSLSIVVVPKQHRAVGAAHRDDLLIIWRPRKGRHRAGMPIAPDDFGFRGSCA